LHKTSSIHSRNTRLDPRKSTEKRFVCGALYQILLDHSSKKRSRPREIRQVASKGKSPYHFCQRLKIMLLQKWQTNEIFKAIQSVGLNPQEFQLENSGAEARLKHKWSRSCFVFAGDASQYTGHRVVGDGTDWPYEVYSWEAVMTRFGHWIKEVKDDLDTPDLWAELQRDARLLGSLSGEVSENRPFTSEEQKDLEQRLREVEAHVRDKYSFSEPEMETLHRKIDYLIDAAGRLGRFDWATIFVGTMVCYILEVGLPVESVRSFITDLLRHLFERGLPHLPLGG
jgi:hypothetical protein